MPKDFICVYRALDIGEADIIVAWLADQGIDAQIKNAFTVSAFQTPLLAAPQGVEVCVPDPADADRAMDLLRDHRDEIEQRRDAGATGATITATCEECGRDVEFPSELRDTVQTCPLCGKHIDVEESSGA